MIVKPLDRHLLQREGALVFLLITFAGCFLLLRPGNPSIADLVEQILPLSLGGVSALLALPFFLSGVQQTGWRPVSLLKEMIFPKIPQHWVLLLLFLAIICHTSGQLILVFSHTMRLTFSFPGPSDIVCGMALLPLLLAIILLPCRQLPIEKRFQIIVDGMMLLVGLVTFSWYFILGPSILQMTMTNPARLCTLFYDFYALFSLFCLLILVLRTNDLALRSVGLPLSLGLVSLALGSIIFCYDQLHHLYWLDKLPILWTMFGYLLIGLAIRMMHVSLCSTGFSPCVLAVSPSCQQEPWLESALSLQWRSLLPYTIIPPIILLLVFTSSLGGSRSLESGVYLGALILVGLLVLRQIFTMRTTVAQNNALNRMQQNLRETNQMLESANGQLKQQAEQLERTNEQLSHLNRLRDQFIANVNHELRTPLTQIDGYLELLSEYQGRLDETTQAIFIQHAKEGSQELLLLINNILDALRVEREVESAHLKNVALWQVVHEVCEQFPPEGEQRSRLLVDLPASLVVQADPGYLRQILRNLLSNALKYSPKEASVTIHAHLVDPAGSSHVRICVQDKGLGIPPEEQSVLFQKFVRLQRDLSGPVRGTGLGLYLCKQLVEAMNGEIWVESSGNKGEGSRFCFTLAGHGEEVNE